MVCVFVGTVCSVCSFVDQLEVVFFFFAPSRPDPPTQRRDMPEILWHTLEIPHCFPFFCGHFRLLLSHPWKPHQWKMIPLAVCVQYIETFTHTNRETL